ncbi:MAG: diguanylate cyclase [gamma proteobacterium symbiont of Taylorina sp.]|nr:diguanylate cyclase [gamma proteobacterium symbiont of Taylorina sp.]
MTYTKIKIYSALFFLLFSLLMFLTFRNYIVEKQKSGVDINIVNTKQYIKKSINYLINEKKQIYINNANIIFSDDEILQTLENKDREGFYLAIKKFYDRVKKRDTDFWGLHIILPDNLSFIRVHKPHVADKLIAKGKKPLIDQVNKTHQQVTSFDVGKFGYFLRVVTPLFSKQKKYLGVAEFSISVDSLTQYIKNKFGYDALFLVENKQNNAFLKTLPQNQNGLILFKSTDKNLFDNYHLEADINSLIDYKNKSFSTVLIKLSDSATIVVAFDVTNIIKEEKAFKKNVTSLISFVIFIFFIIWFIATKLYLKNKKQVSGKMQKFHDIIGKNVIFSNTDLNGIITDVSDAFCQVSGYTREQLIGTSHSIVSHPDMGSEIYENLWLMIKADKIWKGEVKNLHKNGDFYWVDVTISPRFDKNHKKIGYMSIKQNITDKKIIETLSITDSLCGIHNRRHFDELFQKTINASKRKNELVCFLILDIDCFKQYNDTYGHQMGDSILKSIAKLLKESLQRADDNCFRLGGEEFGIIFKAEEKQKAFDFANTIRNDIEKLKIEHNSNICSDYVTASFGLICKNANDIKNADAIYKEADDLLYKAKDLGRNKIVTNN